MINRVIEERKKVEEISGKGIAGSGRAFMARFVGSSGFFVLGAGSRICWSVGLVVGRKYWIRGIC